MRARILVVEDSPDIRVLVRMLLEAAGHEVLTASDGREGVETAKRERPDLVLMDLSLPVMSGWEATKALKETPETASIPVVAVTAHAMHGDRERALAAGCDGFIPKPIDEETFETLVGSYLRPPTVEESSLTEPTPEPPPRTGIAEPGRILVVDDHAEVAEIIRKDLEGDGHRVVAEPFDDRARFLLQRKMEERAELARLVSQVQELRHQTALDVINNIR